jgi:glucose-6-phosphate isomerase/transaldolase/glucose-6-phosphate isomerase
MTVTYQPAADLADRLLEEHLVERIWNRDIGAWGAAAGSADARSISSRLGWLDVARTMEPELARVKALAQSVHDDGIDAVYLLGMGGSSLCAEVISSVMAPEEPPARLFVLDTTDEQTITAAAGRIDPPRTLFLVASKSGGTVEVASLEAFFWSVCTASLGRNAGRQFVAITDPGTALEKLAGSRGYREVFLNPADIGGRFSALSLFGLVPAALVGASPDDLLSAGVVMSEGCRQENRTNAGVELGAFIAAAALNHRDKLTIALPPSLATLGLWIEQLVAESTGKHGKGALPVVDEPLGRPDEYGPDRAFVSIATEHEEPDARALDTLEAAGHPVLRLSTRVGGLGAEFFRWEYATAVAGAAVGINPFDEPNVAEAKEKTKKLLAAHASTGRLPEPAPGAQTGRTVVNSPTFGGTSAEGVVAAALRTLEAGHYVAFLSYLPPAAGLESAIASIRRSIQTRFRVATTYGVGPRYLHSTGQYHKGGPNTALAFVVTGDDATETPIPDAGYSFSVLKRAQALGDADTLAAHERRVVRIHVSGDQGEAGEALTALFASALVEAEPSGRSKDA